MNTNLRQLFSSSEFGWKMRMRKGSAESFFAKTGDSNALQKERLHWLEKAPQQCLAHLQSSAGLISECRDLAMPGSPPGHHNPEAALIELAKHWEPDFILLDGSTFRLAGGCVCLPSSWSLQDSIGRTLTEIHSRVPRLNSGIGEAIDSFLNRIPADQAFFRENWSLTRTADLNYHPALKRKRLDPSVSPSEIFLRLEHQAFVRLPSGVLMGIRIEPICLADLSKDEELLTGLRQTLITMPEEVADYKGLSEGIGRVIEVLGEMTGNTENRSR